MEWCSYSAWACLTVERGKVLCLECSVAVSLLADVPNLCFLRHCSHNFFSLLLRDVPKLHFRLGDILNRQFTSNSKRVGNYQFFSRTISKLHMLNFFCSEAFLSKITGRPSYSALKFTILANLSANRLAPPTKHPSMSLLAINSSTLSSVTLPPY